MPIPVFKNENWIPPVIADLYFKGIQIYPDDRLGVQIRYGNGRNIRADGILYDLGLDKISTDLYSPQVIDWFEEACNDIQRFSDQGFYQELELRLVQYLHFPIDNPLPFFLWAVFSYYDTPGLKLLCYEKQTSHLALRTDRGYINKVRYTYPEIEKTEESDLQQFFNFLFEWTYTVQEFKGIA
jgi:hypothetical protein